MPKSKIMFRTQWNIENNGSFEAFSEPSLTEPDNAMSIPEIIARFTRTNTIPVQQHPWTNGAAPEEGQPMDDLSPEAVLDLQPVTEPAKTEPAKTEPAKTEPADPSAPPAGA